MAVKRKTASERPKGPTSLTMRLFDPGMSPIHRAGLGGLACTLKYIERAYRGGDLTDKEVPGGPWEKGKPPWEMTPLATTLHFGKPQAAESFLKRLFECSFSLKDSLIFLPGQHRGAPSTAVLAELQNGLVLSFLQHGKVRKLAKKETAITYEVDGHQLQIALKPCSGYKHQTGWKNLTSKGKLSNKPVEVVGPLSPGAVVRHVAFQGKTRIEEKCELVLPLYFSLVGCLALPVNRGCGVLLVPEVADLELFAKLRPWMTPGSVKECRIAGGSDAVLQAQIRLVASKLVQSSQLAGCHAMSFKPTPWASQQKSRGEVLHVPPCEDTRLKQFEVALVELPPRIASKKPKQAKSRGRQSTGQPDRAECFWSDSVVRPMVADNLAQGRPWYQGFADLMLKTDPASKRPLRDRLVFEKGGLYAMIEKIPWEDHGESAVVRAVHEAIRVRYGRIASENQGKPGTMKNRWRGEYDKWRLAFSGAKTVDQFRHSLCDLFGRAGINSVLREQWPDVLPMLDAGRWQLTRDLALLALASYKGKGADVIAGVTDAQAEEA